MIGLFKITFACSLLLTFAVTASAEFYQYVDSKGITHFTDNLTTVPAQYRSQLERHREIITLPEESPGTMDAENDGNVSDAQNSFSDPYAMEADDAESNLPDEDSFAAEPEILDNTEGAGTAARTKKGASELSKLKADRDALMDKKEALNKKFEMLQAEKEQIEKNKGDMGKEENVASYNKRVKEMNEKIKQYKEEEKNFKSELDRFNKTIKTLE